MIPALVEAERNIKTVTVKRHNKGKKYSSDRLRIKAECFQLICEVYLQERIVPKRCLIRRNI